MATSCSLKYRITEITTCPICLEDFRDPRSLPCVHSFCLQCLQGHCKDKCPRDDVPCPLCRKEFQIPEDGLNVLPHNFFLENLIDANNAKDEPATSTCEPCSKEGQTESATVYCVDCSQKLCDRCSVPHKNWSGGAHDVRPVGDEQSAKLIRLRGSYCTKHPDKRLELYCFDCRDNICMTCFAVSHQQHKSEDIEKVANYFIAAVKTDIKSFALRIFQFREAVKQVELANEKFFEDVKKTELMVQRKGDELKRLVDDHVTKLLQDLDEIKVSSVKEGGTLTEGYDLALTALESFQAYSSELTSKGSACDITRAAIDLHVRADELLTTHVISGDYIPPDVDFVPTNVNEVTAGKNNVVGSFIHSYGTVAPKSASLTRRQAAQAASASQRQKRDSMTETSRQKTQKFIQSITAKFPARAPKATETPQRQTGKRTSENVRELYLQSSPQIIHTFPGAEDVRGVTLLNNELYVLRHRDTDQVDVYSTTYFTLLRRLSVKGLSTGMQDIASCVQKQCIYVADCGNLCVHRMGLDESVSKWHIGGAPWGLSVTAKCNLLVACCDPWGQNGKLVKLNSKNGKVVREITLQADIEWPWHGVRMANNQYVVCHGMDISNSGVSLVGSDGRVVRRNTGEVSLDWPRSVAVDDDGFMFVSDNENHRIVLFDPALNYVQNVMESMECKPVRLCYHSVARRLYIGQNNGIVAIVQL